MSSSSSSSSATEQFDAVAYESKFKVNSAASHVFADVEPVKDRRVRANLVKVSGLITDAPKVEIAICSRRVAGIDDPVYEKNIRSVWERVPRGHVRVLELPAGFNSDANPLVVQEKIPANIQQQQQSKKKKKKNEKSFVEIVASTAAAAGGEKRKVDTSEEDDDDDDEGEDEGEQQRKSSSSSSATSAASSAPQQKQQQEGKQQEQLGREIMHLPAGTKLKGEVFGMRKFGYREHAYGKRDKIDTVVCIEKLNGECAHVGAIRLGEGEGGKKGEGEGEGGHACWVVGSKHCHIVVSDAAMMDDEDFDRTLATCYSSERFTYACKIAKLFREMISPSASAAAVLASSSSSSSATSAASSSSSSSAEEGEGEEKKKKKKQVLLTSEQRKTLINSLIENNWTMNAEAIFSDMEHLVDYDGANELRFFAITTPNPSIEGLCMIPEKAFEIFASVGLPYAKRLPRVKYDSKEYHEQIDKIAKSVNFEGVVVYGSCSKKNSGLPISKNNNNNNSTSTSSSSSSSSSSSEKKKEAASSLDEDVGPVVCVWKEKSYPYVMERIAREAITGRTMTGSMLTSYLEKRLATQEASLRKHFVEWETKRLPYLVEFASYLVGKGLFKEMNPSVLRNKWLRLQKGFDASSPEERQLLIQRAQVLLRKAPPAGRDVIMFVAPPGGGKSTLSRSLRSLLNTAGKFPHVEWINQDEIGKRNGYMNAIKTAISDSKVSHLILDKCNLHHDNRRDYYEDLGFAPTITFLITHPDGVEELANTCVERITSRGQGHKNLCVRVGDSEKEAKDIEMVRKVIHGMLEGFHEQHVERECGGSSSGALVKIDIRLPPEEQLALIWKSLRAVSCKEMPADISKEVVAQQIEKSNQYEKSLEKKK